VVKRVRKVKKKKRGVDGEKSNIISHEERKNWYRLGAMFSKCLKGRALLLKGVTGDSGHKKEWRRRAKGGKVCLSLGKRGDLLELEGGVGVAEVTAYYQEKEVEKKRNE